MACTYIHNVLTLPLLPKKDSETKGTWSLKQVVLHVLNAISLLLLKFKTEFWSSLKESEVHELIMNWNCQSEANAYCQIKVFWVQMISTCPSSNSPYTRKEKSYTTAINRCFKGQLTITLKTCFRYIITTLIRLDNISMVTSANNVPQDQSLRL